MPSPPRRSRAPRQRRPTRAPPGLAGHGRRATDASSRAPRAPRRDPSLDSCPGPSPASCVRARIAPEGGPVTRACRKDTKDADSAAAARSSSGATTIAGANRSSRSLPSPQGEEDASATGAPRAWFRATSTRDPGRMGTRRRCSECRHTFIPSPRARSTQRDCCRACRTSRNRKLARARRRTRSFAGTSRGAILLLCGPPPRRRPP